MTTNLYILQSHESCVDHILERRHLSNQIGSSGGQQF